MILALIIISFATGTLGLLGGMVLGDRGATREQKRLEAIKPPPLPVNVFDGGNIVLPEPDDPRWVIKTAACIRRPEKKKNGKIGYKKCECLRYVLVLNGVVACVDHGVTIDNMQLELVTGDSARVSEYARQVRASYMSRRALGAVEAPDDL